MLARPVTRRIGRACFTSPSYLHPWIRLHAVRTYATEEQLPFRTYATEGRLPLRNYKFRSDAEDYKVGSGKVSSVLLSRELDESYIIFEDQGEKYPVNILYLRDACRCSQCVDKHSGQKRFDTVSIPRSIYVKMVTKLKSDNDGGGDKRRVSVTWGNDISGWNDHTSAFSLGFIKTRHREKRAETHRAQSTWSSKAQGLFEPVDYHAYLADDDVFGTILAKLSDKGLALINNVPESETSVEKIVERIGNLRDTFYGRTWDVRDKPQAENVAYTSQHLGLHMDLMYMKQPPGFQFLHCLKSSCEGGESIFSDSFRAASIMSRSEREHFDTLTKFKTGYHYRRNGKLYQDAKPTFELHHNERGNVTVDLNGVPQVEHVNWSPPFQSPFPPMKDIDHTDVDFNKYHAAASKFSEIVNHPTALVEYRLSPGECVIFNNRRVLHGRKAFKSGEGERWLKGAYLNTDEFTSAYRTSRQAARNLRLSRRKTKHLDLNDSVEDSSADVDTEADR